MKPILFFLYVLVTLLLGCNKTDVENNTHLSMNPDYTIAVHDTIQIALDSNPTTGYSWKWTNKERVTIVTSDGAAYIPIQVKKGIMGSGGKEMWKFIGVKSGTDSIKLEYRRPWDTSSTIMTKIIYVKVK